LPEDVDVPTELRRMRADVADEHVDLDVGRHVEIHALGLRSGSWGSCRGDRRA